jgi:hypothetical protein
MWGVRIYCGSEVTMDRVDRLIYVMCKTSRWDGGVVSLLGQGTVSHVTYLGNR